MEYWKVHEWKMKITTEKKNKRRIYTVSQKVSHFIVTKFRQMVVVKFRNKLRKKLELKLLPPVKSAPHYLAKS